MNINVFVLFVVHTDHTHAPTSGVKTYVRSFFM